MDKECQESVKCSPRRTHDREPLVTKKKQTSVRKPANQSAVNMDLSTDTLRDETGNGNAIMNRVHVTGNSSDEEKNSSDTSSRSINGEHSFSVTIATASTAGEASFSPRLQNSPSADVLEPVRSQLQGAKDATAPATGPHHCSKRKRSRHPWPTALTGRIFSFIPLVPLMRMRRLSKFASDAVGHGIREYTHVDINFVMSSRTFRDARPLIMRILALYARGIKSLELMPGSYRESEEMTLILQNNARSLECITRIGVDSLHDSRVPVLPNLHILSAELLTPENATAIATKCSSITSLVLSCAWTAPVAMPDGTYQSASSLSPILRACVNITSFHVSTLLIPPEDLREFVHLTNLRDLKLFWGGSSNEECRLLSMYVAPALTDLKLSGYEVNENGVLHFAHTHANLQCLDIAITFVSEHGLRRMFDDHRYFASLRELTVRSTMVPVAHKILKEAGRDDVKILGL